MRRSNHSLFLLAGFAASVPLAHAQEPSKPAKAAHVITDGQLQVNEAFKDRKEWIREFLFVEASFDSDGDGRNDRMHVDVTRPAQTASEGFKVPVVYETSPYFAGTGPAGTSYFWNPKHEVGAVPPPRQPMQPIGFGKQPGMIVQNDPLTTRWVPRGVAVVHSCSPGTGWSQGCPTVGGDNESLAPKAVIDWLCGRAKGFKTLDGNEEVKAEWCTGKVAMIGTSYNGTLPIAAATTGVEGLVAIVPVAPNTCYYRYYRSNGLVRHPGGYLGEDIDVLYDFIASGDPKRRDWCIENVRDGELAKNADRISGDYNEFWAGRDYANKLAKYQAATLMAHGWNDWNVMPEHSVSIYVALKQKGVPAMAYFHQQGHGGDPPLQLVNRWFTRFLFDVDNGVEKDPKAWIVREGDRQPTAYPDYPHPDAAAVALHLGKGGRSVGALQLAAVGTQGTEMLVDDVGKSGAELASAEASPHRLLYALPELKAPLHLSGTARLRIKLACNKPATNLSVWLVSLPWTDSRKLTDDIVTRGWADPQNHSSSTKGEPLEPGKFYELAFDLQPDDQVLAAGERLALMIMASDRDFTLWPEAGTQVTVDLDGTSLTIPVVGGGAALQQALGAAAAGDGKR
jgi:X-Pro dipeptidyl-peptidase